MVSIVGTVMMVLGRHLVLGYLDPLGHILVLRPKKRWDHLAYILVIRPNEKADSMNVVLWDTSVVEVGLGCV